MLEEVVWNNTDLKILKTQNQTLTVTVTLSLTLITCCYVMPTVNILLCYSPWCHYGPINYTLVYKLG